MVHVEEGGGWILEAGQLIGGKCLRSTTPSCGWDGIYTCFLREIFIVGVGGHRGVNSGGSLGL